MIPFARPLAIATLCSLAPFALAQGVPHARPSDIARWSQPDNTPAKRKATARKEAVNARGENLRACRELSSNQRPACLREANRLYRVDMANLERYGALLPPSKRPRASLTEEVVTLVEPPYQSYGSSELEGSSASGAEFERQLEIERQLEREAAAWDRRMDDREYWQLRERQGRGLGEREPEARRDHSRDWK